MPTVKDIPGPYRFYFYSIDSEEPAHVHVKRDKDHCKFWLEPVSLAKNSGFKPKELGDIRKIIVSNFIKIMEAWDEHFGELDGSEN
ncbi:MAG: DUF4160 domain-containing protein [Planctomycetes bacterium]|nr:DUF4160 domain-containing protein [Planctomycetota bacterium]